MKTLFATILALTTSTSVGTLAIASPANDSPRYLSALPVQANPVYASTFTTRSLNIAKQIPNEAIGLLMFDVDPRSWRMSNQPQSSNYTPISPITAIDRFFTFLDSTSESELLKDVQSWLGSEVALTLLLNPTDNKKLMFVAMLPVADDKQFDLLIKKIKSRNLSTLTETAYQGVQILELDLKDKAEVQPEIEPENSKPDQGKPETSKKSNISQSFISQSLRSRLKQAKPSNPNEPEKEPEGSILTDLGTGLGLKYIAIAKLPNGMAIIADDRQAMKMMIDLNLANVSSEAKSPSFADNQLFLRSLNNPLWNRSLIAGYGDFKGLTQFAESLAEDLPETSEIPGFSRAEYMQGLKYSLSQYSSFDLFTWITPKGLRSQSNNYFSEVRSSPSPKDTETRDRLLAYLPSNIYGAVTSRNLNQQWQWFVNESKQQPTYKVFVEGLRTYLPMILGAESGIDIEKDFISWMDGEYAFVAFPSDRSPFKSIGVDLTIGMLIRTSKPDAANASLNKLTNYLADSGKDVLQVKKRQVGTTLLTSFEFPDGQEGKTQSLFAFGWRDRQTLMLTLGYDTAAAFIPIPNPSLADSDMFRDAISEMPQPNLGYFYLDANAIAKPLSGVVLLGLIPSFDDSANPELSSIIKKAVDRLGGLIFVYSETSDRLQTDFFLGLKP